MSYYAKALIGGLTAALAALGTGLENGHVSGPEWVAVLIAFVGGLGLVYVVPNRPGPPPPPD
jgi:hypothetical protein